MRRKSYFARLLPGALSRQHQPALQPPRLLFRPASPSTDVSFEAPQEFNRVSAHVSRPSAAANPQAPRHQEIRVDRVTPASHEAPKPAQRPVKATPATLVVTSPTNDRQDTPSLGRTESRAPAQTLRSTDPATTLTLPEPRQRAALEASNALDHDASIRATPQQPGANPRLRSAPALAPAPVPDTSRTPPRPQTTSANSDSAKVAPVQMKTLSAPETGALRAQPSLPPRGAERAASADPTPIRVGNTGGSRIQIGSIEVKITAPPVPVATPAAAASHAPRRSLLTTPATSLVRGFGVVGLRQS